MVIDLRSDTLTLPSEEMLRTVLTAPLGDSGRLDGDGYGCDPTVNALEDYAASLVGKERSLLALSGTMGNHIALLTWCRQGDVVLMDERQHIFRTEKATCDSRFGQLKPVFYHLTDECIPDPNEIERLIKTEHPKLLCLENTHNSAGGVCIPVPVLAEIRQIADNAGVKVHMDGARLFNAVVALNINADEICSYVDSVMFCVSKGLGAPIGSMLCGNRDFILKAQSTKKLLGGNMRQAGVIAAMMRYALEHNISHLAEDHRKTKYAWEKLRNLSTITPQPFVQTNMIIFDVSRSGYGADSFIKLTEEKGLWLSKSDDNHVRMVFYSGITDVDVDEAVNVLCEIDKELAGGEKL